MNRLDDELKAAFQRQEPSPDFTARVLARIHEAPAVQPRLTLWQRLALWFQMPRLGWVAAGAMALLLIIIGIAQSRLHQTANSGNELALAVPASSNPASEIPNTSGANTPTTSLDTAPTVTVPSTQPNSGRRPIHHFVRVVAQQPSAEAEAAKEKVLYALQITSNTLNDAQRAIVERTHNDKPEPVQNR